MGRVEHGTEIRALAGQSVSGDAAMAKEIEGGVFVAIIDALGHGPRAYAAATSAVDFLSGAASPDVVRVLKQLDIHLKGSVGAAVGLCHIDLETGGVRYVGIGNTVVRRFGSNETSLVNRGGVVGGHMRSPREETLTLCNGDVLLFYTDGVKERFGAADYPEILGHEASHIASHVVRHFGKLHDDAGCIAVRYVA